MEDAGPELHQYLVENNTEGRPFDRDTRALMYERAKNVADKKAFGTELDVYADGYTWMMHSVAPRPVPEDPVASMRVTVGGPQCTQPYSSSVLNISAMSFGALGRAAVLAMNAGAKQGRFAHDTGEGGLSKYHLENGGDLIWQIGTGYFGCRTADGDFDPELFRANAAHPQVKMIEIKVSQGAKPGHGGILPGRQGHRGDRRGSAGATRPRTCSRPPTTRRSPRPMEMMGFVAQFRELSDGKPVGFKICIGNPVEFMAIVKAMIATDTYPDFMVVDGARGRDRGRTARVLRLARHPADRGADARPEHAGRRGRPAPDEDRCQRQARLRVARWHERSPSAPTGATPPAASCSRSAASSPSAATPTGARSASPRRTPGCSARWSCPTRHERVHNFHRNTVHALAEMVAAMGLDHPSQLSPDLVVKRVTHSYVQTFSEIYPHHDERSLIEGTAPARFQRMWDSASPDRFAPPIALMIR